MIFAILVVLFSLTPHSILQLVHVRVSSLIIALEREKLLVIKCADSPLSRGDFLESNIRMHFALVTTAVITTILMQCQIFNFTSLKMYVLTNVCAARLEPLLIHALFRAER